jgi:hypothetical protein
MSAPKRDPGEGPKRPPESPTSPGGRRLRDRVSFFEKVWTGAGSGVVEGVTAVDVEEFERRLAEERARNLERSRLERVALRRTPPGSPRQLVQHAQEVQPDGSIQARVSKGLRRIEARPIDPPVPSICCVPDFYSGDATTGPFLRRDLFCSRAFRDVTGAINSSMAPPTWRYGRAAEPSHSSSDFQVMEGAIPPQILYPTRLNYSLGAD